MSSEIERGSNASHDGLDTGVLLNLVRALNLANRNLLAYPDGHPLVMQSFRKVEAILKGVFQTHGHLTLGIAKDTLMAESRPVDPKNPVFRSFARTLFEHGIVSLTLMEGLTVSELMDFDHIIVQRRNDVYRQGGVAMLFARANIRHIQVQLIDYRVFQAQEGMVSEDDRGAGGLASSGFWRSFVRELLNGTFSPLGEDNEVPDDVEPETLAEMLNKRWAGQGPDALGRSGFKILQDMTDSDFKRLAEEDESIQRLAAFISALSDDLRRVFMERFLKSLSGRKDVADNVLSSLPEEIILDALEKHTSQALYVPPGILEILQKLHSVSKSRDFKGTDDLLDGYSRDELTEKFKAIFKEDEVSRFVPLDYQRILHEFITADKLTAPELVQVQQLAQTLTDQSIDVHLTSVIVEIIRRSGFSHVSDTLKESLKARCISLVRGGGFHVVLNVLETVGRRPVQSQDNQEAVPTGLMEVFSQNDFVEEILNASTQWGKEKHFYITELIKNIGLPFVEPLLDRLTGEEDRAIRQFYLDLLVEMGGIVKKPVIERLTDERWYVVRNLLIILRDLNDPSVVSSIHGILDHPHPKVRHELLHVLIKFNDPVADKILLDEIDSPDMNRQLKAIMLAGMSRSSEVSQKLAGLLTSRGFDKNGFGIKRASVQALADIGDSSVLPILQGVLKSRSWFSRQKSNLLKIEIVESLGKYPQAEVSHMLQAIARSGSHVLADRAATIIRQFEVNTG